MTVVEEGFTWTCNRGSRGRRDLFRRRVGEHTSLARSHREAASAMTRTMLEDLQPIEGITPPALRQQLPADSADLKAFRPEARGPVLWSAPVLCPDYTMAGQPRLRSLSWPRCTSKPSYAARGRAVLSRATERTGP